MSRFFLLFKLLERGYDFAVSRLVGQFSRTVIRYFLYDAPRHFLFGEFTILPSRKNGGKTFIDSAGRKNVVSLKS